MRGNIGPAAAGPAATALCSGVETWPQMHFVEFFEFLATKTLLVLIADIFTILLCGIEMN